MVVDTPTSNAATATDTFRRPELLETAPDDNFNINTRDELYGTSNITLTLGYMHISTMIKRRKRFVCSTIGCRRKNKQ
ncbi:MAG: hypothetical protein IPM91_21295 [Bacteroidetes bacterium]|nr:hypothetical protein [Bacteroidota bacterium]